MKKSWSFWLALLLILLIHSCIYSQKKYNAICIAVPHDGDTVELIIAVGLDVYVKKSIRLLCVDTPEVATKNLTEKSAGIKIRDLVSNFILYKEFEILIFEDKSEKFGRLLGEIYIEEFCINDYLLQNNLGKYYMGEKKTEWTLEELQKIINFKNQ